MAAGFLGSAILRATSFSLRYSLLVTVGRCRVLKRLVQSLRLERTHPSVQVSAAYNQSEAMKMILSRESPDSDDLNDQRYSKI